MKIKEKNIEPGLSRLFSGISLAIKEYRRESGMSQKDLATLIGLNQSAISRLERQDCAGYSIATLYRIFDKMNMDIEIQIVEREPSPVNKEENLVEAS